MLEGEGRFFASADHRSGDLIVKFPLDLSDMDILEQLVVVALNTERTAKEAQGQISWLWTTYVSYCTTYESFRRTYF